MSEKKSGIAGTLGAFEDTMDGGTTQRPRRIVEKLILPVVLALLLAIGSVLISLQVRVGKIEGNRWSDADALRSTLELRNWIDERLKAYPPDWLKTKLDELISEVRALDARMRELERR